MTDIAALRAEVDRLRAEFHAAQLALREAEIAASGYSIGEVVRHKRNGKLYRVTRIDPTSFGTVWLHGNPKNKSGLFSKAERHLFDDCEKIT